MGCHSWFYVHIPERKEEMETYFLDKVRERAHNIYKMWKEFKASDFPKFLSSNKTILEYYHNHTLEEIVKKYPDTDIKILKSNKILMDYEWNKEYDKIKQYHIKNAKYIMDKMDSINSIEEYLTLSESQNPNFLYVIHDNKIYIEAEDGKDFDIQPMHDMFRIHSFAEPCYSIEDVLQRCKENNVILTNTEIKNLKNWFKKYPDTIIEFG